MTREKAIDIIKCLAWHTRPNEEDVEQAIKALEQEPCEDAISRKDIYFKLTNGAYHNETIEQFIDRLVKELDALPPVTPQQKTGHWIKITNGRDGHECSVCHAYAPSYQNGDEHLTKYCPNCGAKMESEVEE